MCWPGRSAYWRKYLETKDAILADEAKKIRFLFHELGVEGSRAMVERYVEPVTLSRPAPEALTAALSRS